MSGAEQISYTTFEVPIEYHSNEIPDSARFVINQSVGSLNQNTVLYLDALTFDGITGMEAEISPIKPLSVYPNPFNSKTTIIASSEFVMRKVEVIDLMGRVVLSDHVTSPANSVEVNLANQPEGMYIIKVTDQVGKVSQSKINKVR